MERRHFFKMLAGGAAGVLAFLLSPLSKIISEAKPRRAGFTITQKYGPSVLDNNRILNMDFDNKGHIDELAKALEVPLRRGVMSGDILDGIYEKKELKGMGCVDFPLDFFKPGVKEKEYVAYKIPFSRIPKKNIIGEPVSIDPNWLDNQKMDVERQRLINKMVQESNRGVVSYCDGMTEDEVGHFTKKLLSLMKKVVHG